MKSLIKSLAVDISSDNTLLASKIFVGSSISTLSESTSHASFKLSWSGSFSSGA